MNEAVFVHGSRDVRVTPINLREGGSDETLIDVAAVGICGSDLHYYKDGGIGSAIVREPFIPGHEFGRRLCEDVPELGLRRGALVAVDPNRSCGRCEWCLQGHRNLCPNVEFIGAPAFDGAMAKQIWIPKSQIVALPETMDALEAAMLEPLGVAIHAVDLAKPRLLEPVALVGAGPIGLLILQVLKIAGAGRCASDRAARSSPRGRARTGRKGCLCDSGFVNAMGKGGRPLVIEATNSPFGFQDACAPRGLEAGPFLQAMPTRFRPRMRAAHGRRLSARYRPRHLGPRERESSCDAPREPECGTCAV